MADNTTIPAVAGTPGDTIATDDLATRNGSSVSGEKVQRIKVGYGSDGDLRDVDATHPLPVGTPATPTTLAAGNVTVSAGQLLGFSIRETSGTAAAVVRLRNGSIGAAIVATISLAPGESARDWFGPGGITISIGIYAEIVSGAVEGAVYSK